LPSTVGAKREDDVSILSNRWRLALHRPDSCGNAIPFL
jgi:hypothetical protein